MKNVQFYTFIIISSLLSNEIVLGQAKTIRDTNLVVTTDTTNLARRLNISEEDFLFQVNRFVDLMKQKKPIQTIDEYIIMVKILNTFDLGSKYQKINPAYFENEIFSEFYDLFVHKYDRKYFLAAIQNLHFFSRKGGEGLKSIYYHIAIGFSDYEPINEHDYYHIISK